MKVIKKSDKPYWTTKVQCTGYGNAFDNGAKGKAPCGSTLEVSANDIYITSSTDYTGDKTYHFTIKCPECGCETDIPSNKLPSDIRSFLEGKKNYKQNDNGRDM